MKTIGLLGGMSWESTIVYYQLLNQGVRKRLGGLHSAKIVMHSVDFAEIEQMQVNGEWDRAGHTLARAALNLQRAGADALLICTNLMHKVAPKIEGQLDIPLLHIADAAGVDIQRQGLTKVGLLGARYTMEEGFYRERLAERYDLEVVIPDPQGRDDVHRIIFAELCRGRFTDKSRKRYLEIMAEMEAQGAQGVILGCTEIPLLIGPKDTELPLFNTTALHAASALEFALGEKEREVA